MPRSIKILVGTMTGTAQLVAEEVEAVLQAAGYDTEIAMMDHLDASVLADGGLFLIVSSTYGNGDVPDNAQAFFASLDAVRPRLDEVIYGVIALGDSTYKSTFCHGGLQFDRLLSELGAERVGEPMRHDASSGTRAEDEACAWAARWIEQDLRPARAA